MSILPASLGLMTATLALVVWQRPPEMAHRPWLRPARRSGRGRRPGNPAPPCQLRRSASRARRAGRPDDPGARGTPDRERRRVLRRVVVCALPGSEATLRSVSTPSPCTSNAAPRDTMPRKRRHVTGPASRSYPTWVINGRPIVGEVLSLSRLANLTGSPDAAKFK